MGANAPTTVTLPVHCAPKKAPCPKCGKLGRRKRKSTPRRVRTVASKAIASLEITRGESRARCGCCTTSRSTPEDVLPRARSDNQVRDPVLERILDDGMNIERTMESVHRESLLDLSTGFVSDVLRARVEQLDRAEQRRMVLENFSGTPRVEELRLGRFTPLLATDPISDLPVAFAPVSANDQDHLRRFLKDLEDWGLTPRVVITDGSNLDPAVIAALWPAADHQSGVFHVVKEINKRILDAVRRLRAARSRRGKAGRQKRRGRTEAKARRGLTVKEESHFVFQHRHPIVKRREDLTESERDDLVRMMEYLPELAP
jgi:hypothetical protein